MALLVDSHVNLHGERYEDDLQDVLTRARDAGIGAMLTISDQLSSLPAIEKISDAHRHIWHSVGVHPHHANAYPDLDAMQLQDLADNPRAIGIGECGLDLYYEYSEFSAQEPVFRAHIHAARATGLPLIIHTRDADEHTLGMLEEEYADGAFPILLHCYTSGMKLAERSMEMGALVSFSGIITFKNATEVRAVAEAVPLERLLVETDCPFLAPVPHRGRRNEPAWTREVAVKLAEIKSVTFEEIAEATTDNFFRLFAKADRNAALS